MGDRYNYTGHDRGVVVTNDGRGNFSERPMTTAEMVARETAHKISVDIYRHANYAGACYHEIWELIAKACQDAIDRSADSASGNPHG